MKTWCNPRRRVRLLTLRVLPANRGHKIAFRYCGKACASAFLLDQVLHGWLGQNAPGDWSLARV